MDGLMTRRAMGTRPAGCDRLALVLQGGGALGAYQAGVYEALHEAGLEPDWLAGVSIGGVNAALIAGNPPALRTARLREFWETVTARRIWPSHLGAQAADGDIARRLRNLWSSWLTLSLGQPGFFSINVPPPWLVARGSNMATSFYNSQPLRETLTRLVDVERINAGATRFAIGAVNVATGNFAYFDNASSAITIDHVMASAALPPGLPMIEIGTEQFWDGGLVSNTPLQHLLDHLDGQNAMVFQVDLFSARGPLPRDIYDVFSRAKDIQYSSRTRLITDMFMQMHHTQRLLRDALERLPPERLTAEDRDVLGRLARLPQVTILHLIYQQAAYEGDARDFEFSEGSMQEHWHAGYRDTSETLRHREWLAMPGPGVGVVVHDVHRPDE